MVEKRRILKIKSRLSAAFNPPSKLIFRDRGASMMIYKKIFGCFGKFQNYFLCLS
jgi:hypothetical protein